LHARVPRALLQDYTLYAQTEEDKSIYSLIEGLRDLSLAADQSGVSKSAPKGQTDMCVRYWKLKERPQKNFSEIEDRSFGFESEALTEEELEEKRAEIYERNKERQMQGKIGKMEQKMRESLRKR
jgi:hypothetical protein